MPKKRKKRREEELGAFLIIVAFSSLAYLVMSIAAFVFAPKQRTALLIRIMKRGFKRSGRYCATSYRNSRFARSVRELLADSA